MLDVVIIDIEADDMCEINGCKNLATDAWNPSSCSLREAGIDVGWIKICTKHDIELNIKTVQFFFGDNYNAELRQYIENKRAECNN